MHTGVQSGWPCSAHWLASPHSLTHLSHNHITVKLLSLSLCCITMAEAETAFSTAGVLCPKLHNPLEHKTVTHSAFSSHTMATCETWTAYDIICNNWNDVTGPSVTVWLWYQATVIELRQASAYCMNVIGRSFSYTKLDLRLYGLQKLCVFAWTKSSCYTCLTPVVK